MRPNKRFRDKQLTKPSKFGYEVRMKSITYPVSYLLVKQSETEIDELIEALVEFRAVAGGRSKVIVHNTRRDHRTTVFIERESDVILLGMLASPMIHRVYRLINPS